MGDLSDYPERIIGDAQAAPERPFTVGQVDGPMASRIAPEDLTVAGLIATLSQLPEDLPVTYHDRDYGPCGISGAAVADEAGTTVVVLS